MSIVDGKGLVSWEGGLFTPDSQLLPRVRWAFAQIRAEGGDITLNEAGRPFGVPSDTVVGRNGGSSSGTESGLSTVYYQWGRYLLYLDTGGAQGTPSAANPAGGAYASEHTQGIAIDCNANPTSLRAKYFPMVGLSNTIASESWHWAIRGPSQVDLSGYDYAGENITPISPEEDDMNADQQKTLDEVHWMLEQIKPQTDKLSRIAVVSDLLLWATTDPSQGIRQMIGNLSTLVVKLDSDNLTKEQAEQALKEALAPFTATTIAEQEKAAEARVSEAAAESVAAEPAKP